MASAENVTSGTMVPYRTGADGRFVIPGLWPRAYRFDLELVAETGARSLPTGLGAATVTIRLRPSGVLTKSVTIGNQ